MALNYAAGTPVGGNQVPLYGSPAPFKSVQEFYSENAVASSVVTLTQNTTAIEIAAGATPVIMRWVSVADGTGPNSSVIAKPSPNFDHVIPANTVRRFVVPIESGVNQTVGETTTSVVGQNREYGLYRRVAYKTQANASVYVAEYGNSNSY
jgi:hypothetical protein